MRNYDGMLELRASLIGTMSVIGGTAVGAPIDTMGFKDVLGIVMAGGMVGSAGSTVNLAVKIQESATPTGTGANWSDITNGAPSGSFAFSTLTFTAVTTGTFIPYQFDKDYMLLRDLNRSRWIRAHATLTGTVGLGPKISVGFLLGRPDDTLWLTNATTVGSGNVELTKLL